ncbi:MAG: hypothetical protein P4L33_18610 [Capsulimonadaceae bacterium]|nr:hypothetical protein [Capsulimonadaceae bacterium]
MQIDLERLSRTEMELRNRVERSPTNADARRDLAWCLILLAMYHAGLEQSEAGAVSRGDGSDTSGAECCEDEIQSIKGRSESRSADQFLCEHLWHAQVLDMLPASRQVMRELPSDIGLAHVIGGADMASKVSSKYEAALRRLISDLEDPNHDALGGK